MKFGPVPIDQAEGKILGHNIAGPDGRRALRKGKALSAEDIATLRDLGREMVYVAELEASDTDEDEAARRVTEAVRGRHLRTSGPTKGRCNLYATELGILRVDADRLRRLNSQLGITLATLPTHTPVATGRMVGTVKVIPYGVAETRVAAVEAISAENGPLLHVDPLPKRRVAVILSGSTSAQTRITTSFDPPLRSRIERLGSSIERIDFVALEDATGEADLTVKLRQQVAAGVDLVILAGETAIMDMDDIAPRAIVAAGGIVTCFGAPVDPGNLLMLAYLGRVPVLGAPGCARSPKANIVDAVLPRLLVGDRLTQADIVALGHGGLMEDVPERPFPRSRVDR